MDQIKNEEVTLDVKITLNKEIWDKLPEVMQDIFHRRILESLQKAMYRNDIEISMYLWEAKNDNPLGPERIVADQALD